MAPFDWFYSVSYSISIWYINHFAKIRFRNGFERRNSYKNTHLEYPLALRIPPLYVFFGETMVTSDHLVIPTYMVSLLIISGHHDVISKKSKKLLILQFLVSELIFRDQYVLIVISIEYAPKWWVTWPISHNQLENDQFDLSIR